MIIDILHTLYHMVNAFSKKSNSDKTKKANSNAVCSPATEGSITKVETGVFIMCKAHKKYKLHTVLSRI